ncbi:hypothetical protein DV962_13095 [Staphylococcus pseudintermedius]|nr:hypothetical protein DV962_13095 [Staphylococcus pseudintermedius]
MPKFPPNDTPSTPASDYFVTPWTDVDTGQKWTSKEVAEDVYRWIEYDEPPTPAITDAYTVSETAPSDTDLPWFDPSDGTWSVHNGSGWGVNGAG